MKTAVVCIAKNEDYYLDEWLEYNHKLGFDRIIMYENNWRCPIEKDYLTKIPFDGQVMQLPAYNDFIKNNKEYDWAAFIDCDEFITLLKHSNIKDLIKEYENNTGIALNWFLFGSGGKMKRENNSLLKQFTYRSSEIDRHIKVIMNMKYKFEMILPHNSNLLVVDTNKKLLLGPFNYGGPHDVAYISHYHNKTYEDFEIRCERGRADCGQFYTIDIWGNEKTKNIDVEDLTALNFMYNK
jgi:Glycosyl transferase family 2